MADATKPTRATLAIEQGDTIEAWVNPKTISITKSNGWNATAKVGTSFPTMQFSGGQAVQTSVELLFDRSLNGKKSIKDTIDTLFKAMEATVTDAGATTANANPSGGGGSGGASTTANKRPPRITFAWGHLMKEMVCNCTQLKVDYQMFDRDGTPLRAVASLTLQQAVAPTAGAEGAPTNPGTRGQVGLGAHLIKDGDSLPSLAYRYYGDATEWRAIAEANGIDNPMRLKRGSSLFIPRPE